MDIVFNQNVNGTIEERVRFDADGNTILLTGTTPKMTIGDSGAEDTTLIFTTEAQNFYAAGDDSADDFVVGVGTVVGTSPSFSVDETRKVTISTLLGLPTYAAAAAPASGAASAASGAVIAIHDARSADDCGNIGGGAFTNVCVSDGTNWIDI